MSFQANKSKAVYRWFKYKKAFSAGLVEHLLDRYGIRKGVLLDPFAGSGTALFAAGGLGMKAKGIELLPIGQVLIATRQVIDWELEEGDVARLIHLRDERPWKVSEAIQDIRELRITRGAYPAATRDAIGRFLHAINRENPKVQSALDRMSGRDPGVSPFTPFLCRLTGMGRVGVPNRGRRDGNQDS